MTETKQVITDKTHGGPVYTYPLDLKEYPDRELIRFTIKDRKELQDRKSIYLFCPPGLSVADGASYGNLDLGMIGGIVDKFERVKQNDPGTSTLEAAQQTVGGAEVVGAIATKVAEANPAFGGRAMFKAGTASNPFSVQQFSGVTTRSFTFTFKLVAQSDKEAIECKAIENTFRKFLYPKLGDSPLTFKYPPYFQIQFLKGDKNNTHLPFINLCYLQNMTATYNTSTNAFHPDGSPIEIDLSLTFVESKNMTRDDLYKEVDDYDDAEYTYNYTGSGNQYNVEGAANDAIAAGTNKGGTPE